MVFGMSTFMILLLDLSCWFGSRRSVHRHWQHYRHAVEHLAGIAVGAAGLKTGV